MRSISPFVILAGIIAAIGAVFLVAYLLADTDESAGIEEGVTLNAVLEQPARYEGEQVTVSGEWADNEYFPPEGADEVIVIGDDADETLLVVPRLGVAVPDVDENTVLRVTGVVVRGSASRVGGRGFVLSQDGATIFVSASGSELERLQDGERVRVRGDLARLSTYGADELEQAIRSDPPGDQPRSALELDELPIEVGEPYLLLRTFDGAA